MNDIQQLFFRLTPTTLAAIVADLDDELAMFRQRQAAIEAGHANCDDDFWQVLEDERNSRLQAQNDDPKFCDPVAAILARQS